MNEALVASHRVSHPPQLLKTGELLGVGVTCFRMCATGLPVEKGEVIESALEVSDLKKNVIFGVSMFQNL